VDDAIDPAKIDLDFVPHRRDDLTGVEMDGETVLYEPDTGTVHRLNRMGTVLWACFDGQATLRAIAADLEDVFDAQDPEQLRADVLEFTRTLGRSGLLDAAGEGGSPPR
jgi:PqqD family protein of HPr-rel-A system